MKWNRIDKLQPLDGQLIFPYSKNMDYDLWIQKGLYPVMRWSECRLKAYYLEDYFEITHWLPVPNKPD